MSVSRQISAVARLNAHHLPQRTGASAPIVIGIACVVVALASVLAMLGLQPPVAFPMLVSPDLIMLGLGFI